MRYSQRWDWGDISLQVRAWAGTAPTSVLLPPMDGVEIQGVGTGRSMEPGPGWNCRSLSASVQHCPEPGSTGVPSCHTESSLKGT